MCFYIHPKHQEKKIAKRDIVCYKYGRVTKAGNKFSPSCYTGFYYPFGEKVEQKGNRWPYIHTYRGFFPKRIEKGFHSYSNKKAIKGFTKRYYNIVKCIIPKGTEYFYDPKTKTYVSRALVVQEVIHSPSISLWVK